MKYVDHQGAAGRPCLAGAALKPTGQPLARLAGRAETVDRRHKGPIDLEVAPANWIRTRCGGRDQRDGIVSFVLRRALGLQRWLALPTGRRQLSIGVGRLAPEQVNVSYLGSARKMAGTETSRSLISLH